MENTELKRNTKTGIVEVFKGNKKVDEIISMADMISTQNGFSQKPKKTKEATK